MDNWTIDSVKDLTGKNVIVTGANTGLGFETTKALASKGATVIMACRSNKRATDAKNKILKTNPNAKLDIMLLDLGDLSTVEKFAKGYKDKYKTLDILINNAGVMTTPYMKTKDGFEFQNGVNHLGHFALTSHLFDLLKRTKNSRLVIVSSIAHKSGKMNFDDYMFDNKKDYTPMKSYSQSKLSNLLFMFELNRRIKDKNLDVKVVAAHPGVSRTELTRYMLKGVLAYIALPLMWLFTQSPKRGAEPQIRAALDPSVTTADYYGPSGFKEMRGKAVLTTALPHAHNEEDAKALWELSEKLTNIKFDI
jgi:NAD(P)-dependent dehydrogenase (short-subunit alcohol dehydrogenase family)